MGNRLIRKAIPVKVSEEIVVRTDLRRSMRRNARALKRNRAIATTCIASFRRMATGRESIPFASPRKTREQAPWTGSQVKTVMRRIERFDFLSGYTFEDFMHERNEERKRERLMDKEEEGRWRATSSTHRR